MPDPERHAFIFERVRVTKTRTIPLPGEVVVKLGESVRPGDLIARAETVPGDPFVVDLAADLRGTFNPEQVGKLMLKRVGDRVQAKEVIARRTSGPFGEVHEAYSPVDGVIEFVSHAYARVLIREDAQKAAPVVIVNVSKKLDIPPMLLRAYMRYREGDEVRQGAIIADSQGGFGLEYCYAPTAGVIEKICTKTGAVTIVRPTKSTEVDAYLLGRVAEVFPETGARVEATAAYVQGLFGLGFENHGVLRVVAKSPEAIITADDLTPDLAEAIVVGGANITLEAMRKAVDLGVAGIITGGANHADLAGLLGQELGVGITGQEDLALTVILTEGFGTMPMASDTFELLKSAEGRLASVNGSTQVRAGAIRPEIIIPSLDDDGAAPPRPVEECLHELEHERGDAVLGSKVRIVRNPKFGQWGTVVALPDDPVAYETEAKLLSAEVELSDGQRIFVPLANLEIS